MRKMNKLLLVALAMCTPGVAFSDTCEPLKAPIESFHVKPQLQGTSGGKPCSIEATETVSDGAYRYSLEIEFTGKKVQTVEIDSTCAVQNKANSIKLLQYQELAGPWGGEQDGYVLSYEIKTDGQGAIQSVKQVEDFWLGPVCKISD